VESEVQADVREGPPGSGMAEPLRANAAPGPTPRSRSRGWPVPALLQARAWMPTAVAVLVIGAIMAVLQSRGDAAQFGGGWALAVAVVIALTRALTSQLPFPLVRLSIDVSVTTALVLVTGSWFSPFYLLLIAGIWWAACQAGPPWSGLLYASIFAVEFGLAAMSASLATDRVQEAIEDVVLAIVVGLLADLHLRIDARAMALTNALADLQRGGHSLATLHARLTRAVSDVVLPLDSLLVGGQMGLKAQETELLGLLMLGLTNQQIADAMHVSEATVKYRLTHLYRRMGVHGRPSAVARGHQLGLALSPEEVAAISGALDT
jgi:DNA-binding CsgD family transcriptional regulator